MKWTTDQRGLVSLITATIISILLSIIVIGMVALMALLQRQATDSADAMRAYYAAEAGVEDGLLKVENALPNNLSSLPSGCQDSNNNAVPLDGTAEYTCQQFSNTSNTLTGTLTADGTPLQLDLSGFPVSYMVIRWNTSNDAAVPSSYTGPQGRFPDNPTGNWTYPSLLELISASYQGTALGSPATLVIQPGMVAATSNYNTRPGLQPVSGGCSASTVSGYNCSITVNGFNTAASYILRLKARYAGTHYQIQFYNTAGQLLTVPDQFETVDVTARVGDVYQRLVEKVPINSGVASLDYVLFADNSICKNIEIYPTLLPPGVTNHISGCPY